LKRWKVTFFRAAGGKMGILIVPRGGKVEIPKSAGSKVEIPKSAGW